MIYAHIYFWLLRKHLFVTPVFRNHTGFCYNWPPCQSDCLRKTCARGGKTAEKVNLWGKDREGTGFNKQKSILEEIAGIEYKKETDLLSLLRYLVLTSKKNLICKKNSDSQTCEMQTASTLRLTLWQVTMWYDFSFSSQ